MSNICSSKSFHYLLILLGAIEIYLFAGVTYGWSSIVIVFKKEGYFNSSCTEEKAVDDGNARAELECTGRDNMLALVYVVASVSNAFSSIIGGAFFDRFGTAYTKLTTLAGLLLAYTLILLSLNGTHWLLFPAFVLMKSAGLTVHMVNLTLPNLSDKYRSTFIVIYCGIMDSSATVYNIALQAYANGYSARSIFTTLLLMCSFCLIPLLLFPKEKIPWPADLFNVQPFFLTSCTKSENNTNDSQPPLRCKNRAKEGQNFIRQHRFWTNLIWNCILAFIIMYYTTAFNSYISNITEEENGYTNIFARAQYLALLITPFAGLTIDKYRHKGSKKAYVVMMSMTSCCALLMIALMNVHHIAVIYINSTLYVICRSMTFALSSAYILDEFSMDEFGRSQGVTWGVSAAIYPLSYLLVWISTSLMNYDYTLSNLIVLSLSLITFVHPINIFRNCT